MVGGHLCSARKTVDVFVPFFLHGWPLGSKTSPRLALTLSTLDSNWHPALGLQAANDCSNGALTMWATWTHWTHAEFELNGGGGRGTAHGATRGKTHVGGPIKVKVLFVYWPVRGKFKRGMQAWVGRARTADARFLRSIIDRCVSLLDSIAPPLGSTSTLARVLSYALSLLSLTPTHFTHTSHTLTPPPRNHRPPWPLSSRPAPHFPIPSLHEELRTRTSLTALS